MHDRILCPTDGSDGSTVAIDHAIEQTLAHGATLHFLYVIEENLPVVEAGSPAVYRALQARGERALDDAARRARAAGLDEVHTAIGGGTPHRVIVQYAADHDVDLVVMGTHGRHGLNRYLLGSVAERVVRTADCPVTTVRSHAIDPPTDVPTAAPDAPRRTQKR